MNNELVSNHSSSESTDQREKITEQQEHTLDIESHDEVVAKSRGVARIELVKTTLDKSKRGRTLKILFAVSIMICAWAYALDSSTTYNYDQYATSSYNHHSMLSTLQIATSIISAVSHPFLAKISDVTSRPVSYIIVLTFYVIGYIIIAASHTISAYIVGSVLVAVGSTGISLLNSIIVGDMTPLKYRGLMHGIVASPYLINTWFSGLIVNDLAASNWRWGYGMFAIIMPVVLSPAIFIMFYLDKEAQKNGEISITKQSQAVDYNNKPWPKIIWDGLIEIDALGLIIMGFGWSLLLLPFSLEGSAKDGWRNPSLIAMFVVGALLLVIYAIYEIKFAPFPSMPRRVVFNRTFITAVVIDFFYMFGGYIRILYLSSYVFIVTDLSVQNWTYYNNTLTMALCSFGIVAGAIFRFTHRYKYTQMTGIAILIIGQGIVIRNKTTATDVASLVMQQLLAGAGGAFSVVGSQVSSQASVPHQDMSLVIALLSLWSSIGAAIGAAVAAPIWTAKLTYYLRLYMPDYVTDEEVLAYFGSVTLIRENAYGSELRDAAVKAYQHTAYYLFTVAIGLYFICFIASCFQSNYYLGDEQNAIEGHENKKETVEN